MYLAVCTRPDVAYAVSAIARMSNHLSKEVCAAVDHLFAHLNKNRDFGIVFWCEKVSKIICHSDSDYAGDQNDNKSTSGVTFFLGLTIIWSYSSEQSTNAQSSTDAKSIYMTFATKEVDWARGLLTELYYDITLPTQMRGDNQISYLQKRVKEGTVIWAKFLVVVILLNLEIPYALR